MKKILTITLGLLFAGHFAYDPGDALAKTTLVPEGFTKRFWQKVKFKIPKKAKISEVIYGNDVYGYFTTKSVKRRRNQLIVNLLPPGFEHPIYFKAKIKGKLRKLGKRRFESPLPPAFASLDFKVVKGKFSRGFFLLSGALPLSRFENLESTSKVPDFPKSNSNRFSFMMALNRIGEIVWIYIPHLDNDPFHAYVYGRKLPNGRYGIIMGKKDGYLTIVNHLGETVRFVNAKVATNPYAIHHDFTIGPNKKIYAIGNRLAYLRSTGAPFKKGSAFLTNTILRINMNRNQAKMSLDMLDYIDPVGVGYWAENKEKKRFVSWELPKADHDFFHANAISFVPAKGFLVSMKHLDKLAMFSRDLDKLLWTIGPTKKDTYRTNAKSRFSHQHAPVYLDNGNIMLFDNGFLSKKSRIMEVRLNSQKKSADLVWEFSPKPPMYAENRSGAIVLDNGNILSLFVNPTTKQLKPNKDADYDYLIEIDRRRSVELARMRLEFFTLSPGYRVEFVKSIGPEKFMGSDP